MAYKILIAKPYTQAGLSEFKNAVWCMTKETVFNFKSKTNLLRVDFTKKQWHLGDYVLEVDSGKGYCLKAAEII